MQLKMETGVRKALAGGAFYVFFALLIGGAVGGCVRKPQGTPPLQGELRDAEGMRLSLFVPFRRELGAVDSAVVVDGRFRFTNGSLRGVYVLSVAQVGEWLVYLSDTPTRVVFNDDAPLLAQPYGDTLNWVLRENHALVRKLGAQLQELSREYAALAVDGSKMSKAQADALDAMWRKVNEEFDVAMSQLIAGELDNPVGIVLLRQYKELFSPEDLASMRGAIDAYSARHAEDAHVKELQVYLSRSANLLIGANIPHVAGVRVDNGERVYLDSLAARCGGDVLVQFWTLGSDSSEACVSEMGRLLEEYGGRGFGVIGLCFAPSREEALAYVQKRGVSWPNILVYSGISEQYGVWGGERNFFYNGAGKLLLRDVSVRELEERLGAVGK